MDIEKQRKALELPPDITEKLSLKARIKYFILNLIIGITNLFGGKNV